MSHLDLTKFLVKSAASLNPVIRKRAENSLEQLLAQQEEEQIPVPILSDESADAAVQNQQKDEVDNLLTPTFTDLNQNDTVDSSFGKEGSAYTADVQICTLPKATQEDIKKFVPVSSSKDFVVQYGMTVLELEPKVDDHNYKTAITHVETDLAKKGKRSMGDQFQSKIKDKYILLMNDRIIDGHHFLALASKLSITCSLRVLDLTPIRFQEKRGSVYQLIKKSYGKSNNSRKSRISLPWNSRAASISK